MHEGDWWMRKNVMKMDHIKTKACDVKTSPRKMVLPLFFPQKLQSWFQMEESSTCWKYSQPENTEPVAPKGVYCPEYVSWGWPHWKSATPPSDWSGIQSTHLFVARKSLRECHFWKVITIFPEGYILNSKSPLRWLSQPLSMCTQVLRRAVPMKLQLHSILHLAWQTKHLKN